MTEFCLHCLCVAVITADTRHRCLSTIEETPHICICQKSRGNIELAELGESCFAILRYIHQFSVLDVSLNPSNTLFNMKPTDNGTLQSLSGFNCQLPISFYRSLGSSALKLTCIAWKSGSAASAERVEISRK